MRRLFLFLLPLGLSAAIAIWLLIRHSAIAGLGVLLAVCLLSLHKPPIEPN